MFDIYDKSNLKKYDWIAGSEEHKKILAELHEAVMNGPNTKIYFRDARDSEYYHGYLHGLSIAESIVNSYLSKDSNSTD